MFGELAQRASFLARSPLFFLLCAMLNFGLGNFQLGVGKLCD